eukprot:SAG31_NODE_6096_length_2172_cov_1.708635_1_plen_27_part_10
MYPRCKVNTAVQRACRGQILKSIHKAS